MKNNVSMLWSWYTIAHDKAPPTYILYKVCTYSVLSHLRRMDLPFPATRVRMRYLFWLLHFEPCTCGSLARPPPWSDGIENGFLLSQRQVQVPHFGSTSSRACHPVWLKGRKEIYSEHIRPDASACCCLTPNTFQSSTHTILAFITFNICFASTLVSSTHTGLI